MDKVIVRKRWSTRRILAIVGIAAIVGLISASYYFTSGKSRLNVNTEKITISEIKKGAFRETTPVNGMVLPHTTIYLDAMEGGRVEEKYVEDGAVMKKDQPIMKLVNTDLELSLSNQETSVFNVLTQMQISRDNTRQNTISKLNQMADVDNALKEAERVYQLNKHLYENKVIGSQEFKSTENLYNYQVLRKKLTEQILNQDSTSTRQQLNQMKQSYDRMKNALALMQRKVGDLIVRSPVEGQLTSLDSEIGQSKNKGERLGQIDVLSGFKVRAEIDQHYLSRIIIGLTGEFVFANKSYQLKVSKVFTQVTNGRFQVELEFIGVVPSGLRRGQTLQILLALSDETEALLLARGGFYQITGGNWIFKVAENGKIAYRIDLQLGRQSTDYYEVLQGLQPGDKVITSSYENYGTMQELVLRE
ncbi:MAG: efflux RND transporter periplasmic adaptor subunit [Chitinophagaceae bacterium]